MKINPDMTQRIEHSLVYVWYAYFRTGIKVGACISPTHAGYKNAHIICNQLYFRKLDLEEV
jgi:hypothetical protein